MKWKYQKGRFDSGMMQAMESMLDIKFPESYKKIVEDFNAAIPVLRCFYSGHRSRIVEGLLSWDPDVRPTVVDMYRILKKDGDPKLVPFANDPFGNMICFDFNSRDSQFIPIVFWNHEFSRIELIAPSFSDFIANLEDRAK